jgi:hypothetical protein
MMGMGMGAMGAAIRSQAGIDRCRGCDPGGLWKLGFAAFPQTLENPPGFPQTHSPNDEGNFT